MTWNLQILNISLGIHSLTKAYDIYESLAEGGENSLLQRRLSLQTLQNWKKSLGEKSALGHNKPNKHVHNRVFIQSYDFQIYDQNPDVGAEDVTWLSGRSFFLSPSLS